MYCAGDLPQVDRRCAAPCSSRDLPKSSPQDVAPEQESCAAEATESDSSEWEDVGFDFGDLEPEPSDVDPEEQAPPLLSFDEADKPFISARPTHFPMRDSASPETRPRCPN